MEFVDFAALTLHDVKNRLAIMAGRAEAKGDSDNLHGLLESAAALTRLLVLYKAEKGRLGLDVEARVPADLLEELVAEIGKQTALTVTFSADEAPTLWFYDEHLVRMVLLDALYNALRHARTRITLRAVLRHACLEFTVRDDGPGYPARLLGLGPDIQALSREGTGLGLHLAGRVAALHCNALQAGTIELSNDGGAVFCLRLPQ